MNSFGAVGGGGGGGGRANPLLDPTLLPLQHLVNTNKGSISSPNTVRLRLYLESRDGNSINCGFMQLLRCVAYILAYQLEELEHEERQISARLDT